MKLADPNVTVVETTAEVVTSEFILYLTENDTSSGCLKKTEILNCACVKVMIMNSLNGTI